MTAGFGCGREEGSGLTFQAWRCPFRLTGRVIQGAVHWYLGPRRTTPYPAVALPPYLRLR